MKFGIGGILYVAYSVLVVGIVTGYGLDGPGIESRWWREFPLPSIPALEPIQPAIQGVKR